MRQHNFLQQKAIEHPRTAGAIISIIGLYFTYAWLVEPYRQIIHQEPKVNLSIVGTVMGIFLPVIGLVFLITGNKYANEIFMSPSNLPKRQKILFYLVLAIVVCGSLFWFVNWLSAHGYKLL